MKYFFGHTCHKCGAYDEAKFVFAGPHLKQVCNQCGFYVKFFDKSLVPDVKEIRLRIWSLTNQNIELIEAIKKEVGFVEADGLLMSKIVWWRVYLGVLKAISKDYELVPFNEIDDEARDIAVAWCEVNGNDWIGDKHKLASDIMNYAKRYHERKIKNNDSI